MRFASLGSGSEGNGLVVECGETRVLFDCGFGVRDAATRLGRLGLAPSSLTAILVTHEHSDHVGGVPAFAGKHRNAYDSESKTLSRYDQALCGNSGEWNSQDNICEITDLDVKTDFEDTLCDDSSDGVLYDTCNYERYKDNRSAQIKDFDRIQCTNFNGKWDDAKALCETDDAELQKYLNERHDIYSCITSGHEWNYQDKECETKYGAEKIHSSEDIKYTDKKSIKEYNIKVVIKNPDGLDTERDATVRQNKILQEKNYIY